MLPLLLLYKDCQKEKIEEKKQICEYANKKEHIYTQYIYKI